MIARMSFALAPMLALAACSSDVALGGPNTLVRIASELPGENCQQGGLALHTGLDGDGDTFLDDEEIVSTQFVCNGESRVQCSGGNIITGTVDIRSEADFSILEGVHCVDGDVLVAGTTATTLALSDLAIVTGDLVIAGNDALRSLDGLEKLREVGGIIHIQVNDSLVDIGALGGLKRVDEISIVGNDALLDLTGLETFVDLHASLTIKSNASLRSLAGLDSLVTSNRTITVRGNRSLTNVDALRSLRAVTLIDISGNSALTRLSLTSLEKVDVRLNVQGNASLATVELPGLSTVGDFVRFETNPRLTALWLPNLVVTGSLIVNDNPSLVGLEAPNLVFVTAGIEMMNMAALTTARFNALSSIGTNLFIREVPALSSFTGFAKLGSVGGTLYIDRTNAIDFVGLNNLGVVSGDLSITNNARLNSFAGLNGNLKEVGEDLLIVSNPALSRPHAQAFASTLTVGGTVTVQ